jgi:hypothetical protein
MRKMITIEEMMIKYKGKFYPIKKNMPKKPIK